MKKQFLNPESLFNPGGFTHVVSGNGGRFVFVSGQVALDEKGQIVGRGDLSLQTTQVFENLKMALSAIGAKFSDVVKLTIFVADYKPEQLRVIGEVRKEYLPVKSTPASTLIGVQTLALQDLLIEIEAIAVID